MAPAQSTTFRWVWGAGPLVLMPGALALAWRGQDGSAPTDLERARATTHPLEALPLSGRECLVLEDGFHTTWWSLPTRDGGMLVRWLWARDEADVFRAVHAIPEDAWIPDSLQFDVGTGRVVLFDAALAGSTARESALEIFLPRGRYALSTANVQPDADTCLMVHRMTLIQ